MHSNVGRGIVTSADGDTLDVVYGPTGVLRACVSVCRCNFLPARATSQLLTETVETASKQQ